MPSDTNTPTGPMDPERLASCRFLAEHAMRHHRMRAHATPGEVHVSAVSDGLIVERLATLGAHERWQAEMMAFDGRDLAELLADRDHWREECQSARRDVCRLLANNSTDYSTPQDAARDLGWALEWNDE